MKRQNHGMSTNTDSEWAIEDLKEKIRLKGERNDHREIGKHIVAIAKTKMDLSPEQYRLAVSGMAYELWEKNGRPQDSAATDWSNAEAALNKL